MTLLPFAAIGLGCAALGYGLSAAISRRRSTSSTLTARFALVERAKKEWEAIFDTLNELVLVVEDGHVRRVNNACARAFGVHPRDLVGRPIGAVFAGHSEQWLTQDRYSEIDDPVFKTIFEVTRVPLEKQLVLMARDVGHQRRLVSQLVQTDKMATVGVLAAGVAHEINNPAAYVTTNFHELQGYVASYEKAYTELEALVSGDPAHRSALAQIAERHELELVRRDAGDLIAECVEGMGRIRSIVSTLQSICRRDVPHSEATQVRVDQVLEAVVKTAAPHLRSWGGSLQVSTPEATCVLGHRGQLVQVLLNLVVNAIQAKDATRPNRVNVELRRSGADVVVRITDTGKGISADTQKRLFEPFFTTKPEGLGTGLGLSISRDLVVAHGGQIEVVSEVGQGTTVTVRLPAVDPLEANAPAPAPGFSTTERRLRILVVDDEPNLLRSLERTLARDHTIRIASDGEAAIKELLANPYDVVLCDLNMPGMNGLELHRRIAELDEKLARRFLFFTGQPITETVAKRIMETGLEALQKPLDVKDLSARLLQV